MPPRNIAIMRSEAEALVDVLEAPVAPGSTLLTVSEQDRFELADQMRVRFGMCSFAEEHPERVDPLKERRPLNHDKVTNSKVNVPKAVLKELCQLAECKRLLSEDEEFIEAVRKRYLKS